jgi:hypothetical protein
MRLACFLHGVSAVGPGIPSWDALRGLFDGGAWSPEAGPVPPPASLPPRQARRLSAATRIAVAAAEGIAPALGPGAGWVFASSAGEGDTLSALLDSLRDPEMLIQPLKFQNAVHNAAAGQWSIASAARGPITSLAAYDDAAGAATLKAALQVALEGLAVGVVLFDTPFPPPLDARRPLGAPLAAGLALSPDPTGALARLEMSLDPRPADRARTAAGRALQATGNPVAGLVPLLEALHAGGGETPLPLQGKASLLVRAEAP